MKNEYDLLCKTYPNMYSDNNFQRELQKLLEKFLYSKDKAGYDKFINDISILNLITPTTVHSNILYSLYKIYTNKYPQTYLAFLFDRDSFYSSSASGAASMPTPKEEDSSYASVYLLSKVQNNLYVFTHELGHNIGLNHPFEEFGIPQANTFNYMDYGSKINMFWFWQWKFIQNAKSPK